VADPAFNSADYELLWPRDLFVHELTAVHTGPAGDHPARVERLLQEAFLGDTPALDYKNFDDGLPLPDRRVYVEKLLAYAPRLREHHTPRPYWSARHGSAAAAETWRSIVQLRDDFVRLIYSLHAEGYLDRALPKACLDNRGGGGRDPEAVLAKRLGTPGMWPLKPHQWSEDVFYDLIEVFHDLVARPRTRSYHSWNECGWHYGDFATDIGRALYRWKVNTLLEAGGLELRLADDDEDIGRLVQLVDDARTDLVERTLASPDRGVAGRVMHAIALFRGRAATEHDKRSAVVALALVLEERRQFLKTALFHIANKFAIRHQDTKQHTDYDPMFLNWIFWSYLSTIELSDRLLARQAAQIFTATP
jgi:hypothetical protein